MTESSDSNMRVPEVNNYSDSGLPIRVLVNNCSLTILTMAVMTMTVIFQKSSCK